MQHIASKVSHDKKELDSNPSPDVATTRGLNQLASPAHTDVGVAPERIDFIIFPDL